jgi:hypothetical protein
MATAVPTLTVNGFPNGVDHTQRRQCLDGVAALNAGGTYATNGIPIVWKFLSAEGGAFILETNALLPAIAWFITQAGGLYEYSWDKVHNTLRIKLAGAELANAAAITADTIGFHAEFVKGL